MNALSGKTIGGIGYSFSNGYQIFGFRDEMELYADLSNFCRGTFKVSRLTSKAAVLLSK